MRGAARSPGVRGRAPGHQCTHLARAPPATAKRGVRRPFSDATKDACLTGSQRTHALRRRWAAWARAAWRTYLVMSAAALSARAEQRTRREGGRGRGGLAAAARAQCGRSAMRPPHRRQAAEAVHREPRALQRRRSVALRAGRPPRVVVPPMSAFCVAFRPRAPHLRLVMSP